MVKSHKDALTRVVERRTAPQCWRSEMGSYFAIGRLGYLSMDIKAQLPWSLEPWTAARYQARIAGVYTLLDWTTRKRLLLP